MSVQILIGDCRARMAELPDCSVDSVVCDPPYELGFMGKSWDKSGIANDNTVWAEVLRVIKPGGHLVAFSGTRTYHRMAVAIEDAGFTIRDQLAWVYGSGFPKSHNLEGGLGTALKPAWEPICLARKSLIGSVAQNVLTHGTGALDIDGCRVATEDEVSCTRTVDRVSEAGWAETNRAREYTMPAQGRWPANLCHDGSEEVLAGFPETGASIGGSVRQGVGVLKHGGENARPQHSNAGGETVRPGYIDSGSAARFFYCAKATTEERGEGNNHPTVKPIALMRWLCRLVTPNGGTILDPFSGSGSTLIAADAEQFNAIGCELSPEYAAIAEKRIREAAGMFADVKVAA